MPESLIQKIKSKIRGNVVFFSLLVFSALLPFQFALNPTEGVDLAIARLASLLIFSIWVITSIKNNEPLLKRDSVTYLTIAFVIFAGLSMYFSSNIAWSLRKLLFLLSFFPIYFVVSSIVDTSEKKRAMLVSLVGGASLIAFFGIIQFVSQFVFGIDQVYSFMAHSIAPFFLGNSFSNSVLSYPSWLIASNGTTYMRAFGSFPDPHMFSYYMGLLLPWSIALWHTSKSHKTMFLLTSILLAVTDMLTFTRGGYVALIAATLIVLPLVSFSSAKKLVAGIGIIFFLFTIAPHNPVASRLVSSFDTQEGSNQGRISNWEQAINVIRSNPLGVGIGSYSLAINPSADYREPIYAHNQYLDIAAEMGIHTAIIFIAMLFLAFISFWRASKKDHFFVAGVASIVLFSTHGLVENPLYSVHILPLFIIIIALSTSRVSYEKNYHNS